jgi:hypothetical protein
MRHTEPEAFFSIRSRFQAAGPLVAEPLATSKPPSEAGASAVMQETSGFLPSVVPPRSPPTKTIAPSIKPTAAPPSGKPVSALIGLSKDAISAPSSLSTRKSERSEETITPCEVTARQSGAGASRFDGARSKRSLGRKAPSIGGIVIDASPRPNQLSTAFLSGFIVAFPNRTRPNKTRGRSSPDRLRPI